MMKSLANFSLLFILGFFFLQTIFASDTGKITGTVTDKETGDPLPGANVIISETIIGTSVDQNGYFIMLNVPAGTYAVSARIIGYSTMTITNVSVSGDLTTDIEFILVPTVVEGEEIVVEAERKLIQMDKTDSRRTISSDDLKDMAVTSIEDAVAYTAGAVEDAGGNLHFRGGRSAEVVYLFEGIQLNDPLTGNSNDSDIPIMAVGETNIITGGFGADYGDAQSGIINVTGREGRNTFAGDIRYSTSNGVSETFTGENPHNFESMEFFLSGPLLKNRAFFSVAGEINEDYGYLPNQFSDLNNFSGKFSLKITDNIKLSFSGLYSHSNFNDGFSYSWSHRLSEDKLTEFIPGYLNVHDGEYGEIADGILQDEEIPEFYSSWWSQDGLQTEDVDGDEILDMYFSQEPFADWNGNGQWDEGEYFNDLDNSGSWTDSAFELDYDANGMLMAPDGDLANEDENGNFILESESATDTWYGNGQLDSEDLNGNGVLDEGEDINGNNVLDSEDLDRNGSLTEFSMFDRLPLWERMSKMWNIGFTHTLSDRTYYTLRIAQYTTMLESNIIERLNEDTDRDGTLDLYWGTEPFEDLNGNNIWNNGEWYSDLNGNGTYDLNLDWDVDGDGDKRNEDLNGNGVLDSYSPGSSLTGIDDPSDMFHDSNHNNYVDESERDWDGDGIDDYDRRFFWMPWADIPDEGFKHASGDFYGVGAAHPYSFSRDHWHYDKKVTTTIKSEFVSQVTLNHKLSTGLELKDYNLTNFWPPDRYGYAEYYTVKPRELSVYLSDKMEYPGAIVNAGIRMEYFMPNSEYPGDETDPTWTSDDYDDWNGDGVYEQYQGWKDAAGLYEHSLLETDKQGIVIRPIKDPHKAENKLVFAPRLGISHPITDRAMLYFNYGRYYQRPALQYMFRNITYNMGGGFPIVGYPNLDPELTTSYEVGVRYQLTTLSMIEAKGFYKDIFGLTDTRPIYWTVSDWYTTYYNRDYGNVRGFELILLRRSPGLFFGELNYTYSVAKGKSSSVGQGYITEWSGNIVPTFESYLEWDQRHTFNANVNLSYKNFLATMAANFGSGTRYTRPEQGRIVVENTETYPWYMTSNMRVSYKLKLGKYNANLFLYITNLFDLQRFRQVNDLNWYHQYQQLLSQFDSNGDGEVTNSDGQENFFAYMSNVDLDHDGKVDDNKLYPERGPYMHPAVYQEARRFRIGITIGF
jgi:outer membrane receptor protein involved in Fe transport